MHEELQIPLLELALAHDKGAQRHFIAKRLPDLANAEGNAHARRLQDVVPIQIDVLTGLATQVGLHALAFDHTQLGLHEQIEAPGLREFAAALRALRGQRASVGLHEVVGSVIRPAH